MGLTRSRKDRLIAGVCGGVAERLDWSPLLVRLLFLFIPFVPIPIYIMIWILVPQVPEESAAQ